MESLDHLEKRADQEKLETEVHLDSVLLDHQEKPELKDLADHQVHTC